MNSRSRFKFARSYFTCLVLACLLFPTACSRDEDTRVIDFSKTVQVSRPDGASRDRPTLRVAVGAMISPKETFIYYRQVLDYIAAGLGWNVELVQRKTYSEVNELIGKGQIDLAFICSGPYIRGREKYGFELLATPEVKGSHFYQSYLIVNSASPYQSLSDLRKRVFAFTDPDSHSGKLVPTFWLSEMHEQPDSFFGKTIYTYSHDNSIMAVSRALVDGAAVDSLIWEYYNRKDPSMTAGTRIIKKSDLFGIPPVVASKSFPPEMKSRVREILLAMHKDPEGSKILRELMIDRFVAPREEWYDAIPRMERKIQAGK
ncbi:MAG: phosphate/phosphite/phosphonate ABC transporter substrate-binding protein [Syntrophobacteraceae bacterium]